MRYLTVLLSMVLCTVAGAAVVSETIDYEAAGHKLRGTLYRDDASDAARPGVLVLHEWWGLDAYAHRRARMLAELGYVAFAADLYGPGRVTDHPDTAAEWSGALRKDVAGWRARASAALAVLRHHRLVDPSRLAAIGYCFGGATALQLAYAGAPLRAAVVFHGGYPLPGEGEGRAVRAKVLINHGSQDPFTPPERLEQLRRALDAGGVDWEMIYYGRAKHSFTNPGADAHGMEGLGYDERADRRSWAAMRRLFGEVF